MNPVSTSLSLVPASVSDVERMLQRQFQGEPLSIEVARALGVVQQALVRRQEEDRKLALLLSRFAPDLGVTAQYRSDLNLFVGEAYTSLAGNTYFSGLRLAPGVAIKTEIGIGWARVFLNGISLYSTDGRRTLLARRSFHSYFHSIAAERRECERLVADVLFAMLSEAEARLSGNEVLQLSQSIVNAAFEGHQLQTLLKNLQSQIAVIK